MFRPIIRSTLSANRKIAAGNNVNSNNHTFLRAATVVGNSTSSSPAPSVITVATRPISSTSSIPAVPSLITRLHYNKNNTYGIIATPQSYYRRWLSDAKSASASGGEKQEDNNNSDAVAEDDGKTAGEQEEDDGKTAGEQEADGSEDGEEKDEKSDEIDKLKEEVSDVRNQLLRSYAEQENIRSIARRDVQSAKDFSTKSFAKSLLEVSDNLDRALESVNEQTTDDASAKNETLNSFVEGIELTNSGLMKAFKSNGVEAYSETIGDEFDPDKHQALMEYADPTKPAGTIGVVMKKGYTLNGRVLRPAEVGVIKK